MPKLTKAMIDAVAPPERGRITLRDSLVVGLLLRVSANGRKTWSVVYRTRAGKQRRVTLKTFPTMSVDDARDVAREFLRRAARGEDPAADFQAGPAPTVRDLERRYCSDYLPRKKPKSQENDRLIWRSHIRPRLGRKEVARVTTDDVVKLHTALADRPYQANRTLALLSKAFHLAEKWSWRPAQSNPCYGVERFRERKRRRYLTAEEAGRLGAVLARWETLSSPYRMKALGVRLLLLTGARVDSELLSIRKEWIDFARGVVALPDSKTGEKDLILSAAAVEVCRTLDRLYPDSPWLFPSPRQNRFKGDRRGAAQHLTTLRYAWRAICAEAKIEGLRLHDLRHSFASVAIGYAGAELSRTGQLLGHASPSTTQRYSHVQIAPLRQLADRQSESIERLLSGPAEAKVVPLRKGGA